MDDRQKIGHRPSDGNADVVTGFMILGVSIIFAAVISAGIYIGYVEYKAYKIERAAVEAAEALNRQMAAETARQQARMLAEQKAQKAREQAKREAAERQRMAELEAIKARVKAREARQGSTTTKGMSGKEMQAMQNSDTCKFWKAEHRREPSVQTHAGVKKHCPFG